MDRASSIFLDNFAVEKLLNNKLSLVSHQPGDLSGQTLFQSISNVNGDNVSYVNGIIKVKSHISSGFSKNDNFSIEIFKANKEDKRLIFLHGLFEDNMDIYTFLFKILNSLGYTIYLCPLPYHYDRKPDVSQFSGEYFWSGDMERSIKAFEQAAYDFYSLYQFIGKNYGEYPYVCGFSMGAAVILKLISLVEVTTPSFLLNPVTNISNQAWTSLLWSTIKKDLLDNNYTFEKICDAYKEICPSNIDFYKSNLSRVTCVNGLYDKIVEINKIEDFFNKWKDINRYTYKCGHLNMLRVPKLSEDINRFFKSEVNNEKLLPIFI